MLQTTINLYSFRDLSKDVQQTVISNHREFLESDPIPCEDEDGNMVDEYMEYTDDEVTETIEINEYLYFKDGSLASCTKYTGKHEKSGITEFRLHGDIYVLPARYPTGLK